MIVKFQALLCLIKNSVSLFMSPKFASQWYVLAMNSAAEMQFE